MNAMGAPMNAPMNANECNECLPMNAVAGKWRSFGSALFHPKGRGLKPVFVGRCCASSVLIKG